MNDHSEDPGRELRRRVLKQGTIIRGLNYSEAPCIIRNMSANGAELKVGVDQEVPEEFLLYVRHDGRGYRCRQCWREGTRVGIQIICVEDKPSWHYG